MSDWTMFSKEDFVEKWAIDLNIKGFRNVETSLGEVVGLHAFRDDGMVLMGFVVFHRSDLTPELETELKAAISPRNVVVLMARYDLMDLVELKLKEWGVAEQVNLEGIM